MIQSILSQIKDLSRKIGQSGIVCYLFLLNRFFPLTDGSWEARHNFGKWSVSFLIDFGQISIGHLSCLPAQGMFTIRSKKLPRLKLHHILIRSFNLNSGVKALLFQIFERWHFIRIELLTNVLICKIKTIILGLIESGTAAKSVVHCCSRGQRCGSELVLLRGSSRGAAVCLVSSNQQPALWVSSNQQPALCESERSRWTSQCVEAREVSGVWVACAVISCRSASLGVLSATAPTKNTPRKK